MSYKLHPRYACLQKMWSRGTDFLGCPYGILGGAMSWISEHGLVSAISEAGGFGVLASGAMGPEDLRAEIIKTQAATRRNFGVNVIVFHPQHRAMLEVCREQGVSHVFFGGGMPRKENIVFLRETGIRVVAFAPSLALGKRLVGMGVEALVLEGSEAGGHVGPVTTSVLAQEVLPELSQTVPVFIAGGIGTGGCIVSYLSLGAAGCQLGTRFVCAQESIAHQKFKQAFIHAQSRDAVVSPQVDPRFPVIPVRALANEGMKNFVETQKKVIEEAECGQITRQEAQLKIELFWAGALRRAVIEGDVEHGSVMAGQSVGLVKAISPAAAIIAELLQQSLEHLSKQCRVQ